MRSDPHVDDETEGHFVELIIQAQMTEEVVFCGIQTALDLDDKGFLSASVGGGSVCGGGVPAAVLGRPSSGGVAEARGRAADES